MQGCSALLGIMLFDIKTPADFIAVERYVSTLLSSSFASDDSRCSYLRSEPFARVRLHAVYRHDDPCIPPPSWGPNGLCVEIRPDKLVSVEVKVPPIETYDDSWCGPVVYEVLPGFDGEFDALVQTKGPFIPGKKRRGRDEEGQDSV
jgi:hypothetical protein